MPVAAVVLTCTLTQRPPGVRATRSWRIRQTAPSTGSPSRSVGTHLCEISGQLFQARNIAIISFFLGVSPRVRLALDRSHSFIPAWVSSTSTSRILARSSHRCHLRPARDLHPSAAHTVTVSSRVSQACNAAPLASTGSVVGLPFSRCRSCNAWDNPLVMALAKKPEEIDPSAKYSAIVGRHFVSRSDVVIVTTRQHACFLNSSALAKAAFASLQPPLSLSSSPSSRQRHPSL